MQTKYVPPKKDKMGRRRSSPTLIILSRGRQVMPLVNLPPEATPPHKAQRAGWRMQR